MNGLERAQIQRRKGTRSIVETLDMLRMINGFETVQVLTPIVESRLRAGYEPPRALKVAIPLQDQKQSDIITVEFTFQIGYPTIPVDVNLNIPASDITDSSLVEELNAVLSSTEVIDVVEIVRLLKEKVSTICGTISNEAETDNTTSLPEELTDEITDNAELTNQDNTTELCNEKDILNQSLEKERFCVYCCKICSTVLFDTSQLHEHSAPANYNHNYKCTSVFLEEAPLWLVPTGSDGDKIHCIKCKARVGNWSWTDGKCSCEAWIAPAFQFIKSKIDEKTV